MLTEEGVVVAAAGHQAVVRAERSQACEGCGAKGACSVLGGGKEVEIQALNHVRARAGDRVELALPEAVFLKASAVTYVLPLLALLAGAILGQVLGPRLGWTRDAASIVLAALGLVLAGAAIFWANRRLAAREDYTPRIVRVLPRSLADRAAQGEPRPDQNKREGADALE